MLHQYLSYLNFNISADILAKIIKRYQHIPEIMFYFYFLVKFDIEDLVDLPFDWYTPNSFYEKPMGKKISFEMSENKLGLSCAKLSSA